MKDRIAGKRIGFKRVSRVNATLPVSQALGSAVELCSSCKFFKDGEERVLVGSLDLNQCPRLADEITRPGGIGADFARAYLSNVCGQGAASKWCGLCPGFRVEDSCS